MSIASPPPAASPALVAASMGQLYVASSGQQPLVAIGTNLRYTLVNPAGSGKTARVAALVGGSSQLLYGVLLKNPPTSVVTAPATTVNTNFGSSNTPACSAFADVNGTALTGTATGATIAIGSSGIPPGTFPQFDIPPGCALGMNAPALVAATTIFLSIFWYEF